MELDGQIFDRSAFVDRITPPLHFNCRSMLVPITKFEDYLDDDSYVPKGEEPDISDLKEMGGNLIV